MDSKERLEDHIPEKEYRPREGGGFWDKPGRGPTLSMWSAILCVVFCYLVIIPANESAGTLCTALCCMWAGGSLVRMEQAKKEAKGQKPANGKPSDYVRSDSMLGMFLGKNKRK